MAVRPSLPSSRPTRLPPKCLTARAEWHNLRSHRRILLGVYEHGFEDDCAGIYVYNADPRARVGGWGVLGRWGAAMSAHARAVFGVWLLALIVLGAAAPSVFGALAGAGWQADSSESVRVRELAQRHFGGNSSARCRW